MNALRLCIGFALILASAAQAQQPAAKNPDNPYKSGANEIVQTPYWGYSGNPYQAPAASIMDASGKLMLATQQAKLLREEVRSAKLDNRRKRLEQWLWERDNLPTHEDERQRMVREQLRRSRFNPPLTEVWSARALNDLLADLSAVDGLSDRTPIDPNLLEKLNLTTGKGGGNVGFLKGDTKWRPQMLREGQLAPDVDRLVLLVKKAADQVADKHPDAALIKEILRLQRRIAQDLAHRVRTAPAGEFTPAMYIDARVFLDQVNDVVKILQRPDAARYFDKRMAVQGKTVGEVVEYMKANGLRFAPATDGSEDAYSAVHQALAAASRRHGANTEKAK
jgi:hypothetical protein